MRKLEQNDIHGKSALYGMAVMMLLLPMRVALVAALIVTLGMIVDNSIAIIDSTTHFFKSIFSATLAISITFFPFLVVCVGMTKDFLMAFPFAVSIVLGTSLAMRYGSGMTIANVWEGDKQVPVMGGLKTVPLRQVADLNDAYKQVAIAQESIEQSEENLRLNTDYYQAGTSTISDVLDAQTLYQQSRDQYVESIAKYEVKKREYLQATGR